MPQKFEWHCRTQNGPPLIVHRYFPNSFVKYYSREFCSDINLRVDVAEVSDQDQKLWHASLADTHTLVCRALTRNTICMCAAIYRNITSLSHTKQRRLVRVRDAPRVALDMRAISEMNYSEHSRHTHTHTRAHGEHMGIATLNNLIVMQTTFVWSERRAPAICPKS